MNKNEVLTQIYNREAYSWDLVRWYEIHEPGTDIKTILEEALTVTKEDIE